MELPEPPPSVTTHGSLVRAVGAPIAACDLVEAPQRSWVVDRVVMDDGTTMMFSPEKCGKSFLGLRMALSVAAGAPFLGRWPTRRGRVLVLDAENRGETADRLKRLLPLYPGAGENLHVLQDPVNINTRRDVDDLLTNCKALAPVALGVIDAVGSTIEGDLNGAKDATAWCNGLDRIRSALGGGWLVLHHSPLADPYRYAGPRVYGRRLDVHYRFAATPREWHYSFTRVASRTVRLASYGGLYRVTPVTEAAALVHEFTSRPLPPEDVFVLEFADDSPDGFFVAQVYAAGKNHFSDKKHAWTVCRSLYERGELFRARYVQRRGDLYYLPRYARAAGLMEEQTPPPGVAGQQELES